MEENVVVQRLNGIEAELRLMREALVSIARMDERTSGIASTQLRFDGSLEGIYSRLSKLEASTASSKATLAWQERGVWVVLTGALAYLGIHFGAKP